MLLSRFSTNGFLPVKRISFLCACFCASFSTQLNGEETPAWWPHPIWGKEDQAGASNWINAEKIVASMSLVKTGKVYELGHIYERGMPLISNRSYSTFIPSIPTAGPMGDNKMVFNDEFIAGELGQVGTQFDGPGHVGRQITLANGKTTEVFYNGFNKEDIAHPYALKKLGVENVKPYFTRGVLIDIAAYKGMKSLPEAYTLTLHKILVQNRYAASIAAFLASYSVFFDFTKSDLCSPQKNLRATL